MIGQRFGRKAAANLSGKRGLIIGHALMIRILHGVGVVVFLAVRHQSGFVWIVAGFPGFFGRSFGAISKEARVFLFSEFLAASRGIHLLDADTMAGILVVGQEHLRRVSFRR